MTNEVAPKTYPQYCFDLSPTFDTWCLLKATDIASLEVHPGFEGACAAQDCLRASTNPAA